MAGQRVKVDAVYQACDPDAFSFQTTADLEPLTELSEALGQPRAVDSLRFGTGMQRHGFNIFALGEPGTGRHTMVRQTLDQKSQKDSVPFEPCYVNNFDDSAKPKVLLLPAGQGKIFVDDLEKTVIESRKALKASFESEEYQNKVQTVQQEIKDQEQKAFEELNNMAKQKDLTLIRTQNGIAFVPVKEDGAVLSPEEYQQLAEDQRESIDQRVREAQEESQKVFQKIPQWQKQNRERLEALNQEVARYSISPLFAELRKKYESTEKIMAHFDAVEKDILVNLKSFLTGGHSGQSHNMSEQQKSIPGEGEIDIDSPSMRRYKVNLLVNHSAQTGSPVVFEDNPTYANLVGKVEHLSQMGTLITDFNLIKPGSLHQANGGSLIIDAHKILTQPGAWEGLKRALKSECIKIESLAEMFSLLSTVMLEPEPIPLRIKVVLIGSPLVYYLLQDFDPEFAELFKVAADFDVQMSRDRNNQEMFARLLRTIIEKEQLQQFDRGAVGRIIEQASRLVSDSERLTTRIREISDLMLEADYWARENNQDIVSADEVQRAIDRKTYRSDRLRQRTQEEILRGTLMIDTQGEAVGQVNGLAVLQLGNFMFGRPQRITARIQMGKGELVDIEREAKLGGPLHSKGVLILSGFLGARYALNHPLSLKASLVFEQSYGGVEGDSASSAELYALLSAISGVPLKQSFAVTGSVNQFGEIQAIGGVNEKIEGFFDICKGRGLTSEQGVLIPEANVKHLMLRKDVVEAIAEETFHVFAVRTVDEGLERLSGLPAGQPDSELRYPQDTFNGMVQQRLADLAQKMRHFTQDMEQGGQRESAS